MFLRYSLTMDDVIASTRHWEAGSPAYAARQARGIWGLPILFLYLGVMAAAFSQWLAAAAMALLAVIVHFRLRRSFGRGRDNLYRKIFSEGRNASLLGDHTATLADDGLLIRSAVSESKYLWAGIEKVVSTDTHTLIYVGSISNFVLPRNAILEGNYNEFVKALQERLAAAQCAAQSAAE